MGLSSVIKLSGGWGCLGFGLFLFWDPGALLFAQQPHARGSLHPQLFSSVQLRMQGFLLNVSSAELVQVPRILYFCGALVLFLVAGVSVIVNGFVDAKGSVGTTMSGLQLFYVRRSRTSYSVVVEYIVQFLLYRSTCSSGGVHRSGLAVTTTLALVVEHITPTPAVFAAPAPEVEHILRASAMIAARAPVVKHIALAPAVIAARAPRVELFAPAPAAIAAHAPWLSTL